MSKKIERLGLLWEDVQQCAACEIHRGIKNRVFGDGNASARICLVGEGPGEDEDENGHPFQGEAGKLLNRILNEAGLRRDRLFVCNALKCRAHRAKGEKIENRTPNQGEINNCRLFLQQQLEIVRPKVVVALGGTAVAALTGEKLAKVKITKIAGYTEKGPNAWYVFTYHPAYPIHQGYNLSVIEKMVGHLKKAKEIAYE